MATRASLVVVVVMLAWHVRPLLSTTTSPSLLNLAPPPGNSVAIRAITLDGELEYICEKGGGDWLLVHTKATLLDHTNHTKVVGFYTRNYHQPSSSSRHAGTWTLINNEGDEAESGHATSAVSGKTLATAVKGGEKGISDFLAQASLHRYEGTARTVSYIAQTNTTLIGTPPLSNCHATKRRVNLKFKAEYTFWKQDVLPPKVPRSLSIPSHHRVVESLFAQGVIRFNYDHKMQLWRPHGIVAKLYDVPGGIKVGGFSFKSSSTTRNTNTSNKEDLNSLACITVDNPNGYKVCGRQEATDSTSIHHLSLPWSLFQVTSNNGNMTNILGPFSFVQMVSTWGGLPPQTLNGTNVTVSSYGWQSYFTAIFWLYTRSGA